MSWMQKLYETYERNRGQQRPISHTTQQAHVEITLDGAGNFLQAVTVKKEETLIPATEDSAGRTGKKPPPHPLCDKVQYCAADYPMHGGKKTSFFKEYEEQLAQWCVSAFAHSKAKAVLTYVRQGKVVADLLKAEILYATPAPDSCLLTCWDEKEKPDIFRLLTPQKGEIDQGGAFIRWKVQEPGTNCDASWEDEELRQAWSGYNALANREKGLCMVTGESSVAITLKHPRDIRRPGDGAKLISANDDSGFTFRGRFTDKTGQQACTVGYETSQKAHSALRWLIKEQGYRNDSQVVVAWDVGGQKIPKPTQDSYDMMALLDDEVVTAQELASDDVGQVFARRLSRLMAGYHAELGSTSDIVVMALDSATTGRMAIIYYRELSGSEFLHRIESWHRTHAWYQDYGKEKKFIGAPAPKEIAEAAFGQHIKKDKLRKATVERLLPCIIDGRQLPRDLMVSTVRRACNRVAFDRDKGGRQWEWEKVMGIACALYRGFDNQGDYTMALETDRTSRDYLYGRLLAIAEHIEERALYLADEKRSTSAARLMQRFADHPASTWRTLELGLSPYKARLQSKRSGFLHNMTTLMDEVVSAFEADDFINDTKLSGEFLLGYHCQREKLKYNKQETPETKTDI